MPHPCLVLEEQALSLWRDFPSVRWCPPCYHFYLRALLAHCSVLQAPGLTRSKRFPEFPKLKEGSCPLPNLFDCRRYLRLVVTGLEAANSAGTVVRYPFALSPPSRAPKHRGQVGTVRRWLQWKCPLGILPLPELQHIGCPKG